MNIRGIVLAAAGALAIAFALVLFIYSRATGAGGGAATGFVHFCGVGPSNLRDSAFLGQVHASMTKMMAGMDVPPVGSVDADFVHTMVPHHQGAIDMAEAELVSGTNPQLRRIAEEIIVDQQQEIAAMRYALGEPLPPSLPSPDQAPLGRGI
jgi:hypothetical protein